MTFLYAAAAAVTVMAFCLSGIEYIQTRHKRNVEEQRVVLQKERLRSALIASISAAEGADLIVQRSKEPDITIAELQSVARVLRGNLGLLARQLQQEEEFLHGWKFGRLVTQSHPDSHVEKKKGKRHDSTS